MSKVYFSVKEFAAKLDVHPNTIRNAIKSGKIVAVKLSDGKSSRYRIPYSELESLEIVTGKHI